MNIFHRLQHRLAAHARGLLLCSLTMLAACAQSPIQPTTPPSSSAVALSKFRAEGRMAWSAEGKGSSARFIWISSEQEQKIDLLSPIGTVAASITARPGHVEVDLGSQGNLTAASLELLTLRLLDIPLPLTGMEYWAQGLPVPGSPFEEQTLPEGKRIVQRGFTLDYPQWMEIGGRSLPQAVDVRRANLSLKLRIREWILDTPTAP